MTEKENSNNSIIPIGSTGLVRVGNSIELTKKLINQGLYAIKTYNKINFIPFRIGNLWYLYNIRDKMKSKISFDLIQKEESNFIEHFYLYKEENNYFIFDQEGKISFLGNFKYVNRDSEYILGLDFEGYYHFYRKKSFICKIPKIKSIWWVPDFEVTKENCVILKERKYHSRFYWSVFGIYDFNGNSLTTKVNNLEINENLKNNDTEVVDTYWKIKEDGLYYKDVLKHDFMTNNIRSRDVEIIGFNFGFAFVREYAGDDPDFCAVWYDDLGYIDMHGNIYWEQGTGSGHYVPKNEENLTAEDNDLPF